MKKTKTRADLFRMLHGLAAAKFDMTNPHPLLHQLAKAEFEVESMAHLSDKEIIMLCDEIENKDIDWDRVEDLGVTRIPEMSLKQQYLVETLRKELGWSEKYLFEMVIKRYGYLHWKYLTGREAWTFCNYLLIRKRTKIKNKRKKDHEKVSA